VAVDFVPDRAARLGGEISQFNEFRVHLVHIVNVEALNRGQLLPDVRDLLLNRARVVFHG